MASEQTYRGGKVDLSKKLVITRVISMPSGASSDAGAAKRMAKPLPAVSRNPSITHITKTSANDTHPSAPVVTSSTAFLVPKKLSRPSSIAGVAADENSNTASGRWTSSEHKAFLAGLKVYGREWKKVAQCIPTRSPSQIRSHAQKYFNKVSKEQEIMAETTTNTPRPASLALKSETSSSQMKCVDLKAMPSSYQDFAKTLSEDPASAESKVNSTLQSLHKRKVELENHLRRIKADVPSPCTTDANSSAASMGPASAALQAEQQSLRKAAEARYQMKMRSRTPSPKESSSSNVSSKYCANVSLATMPSSGEFDSSEVLALSLLGGNFKRDNIQNNLKRPFKARRTEY